MSYVAVGPIFQRKEMVEALLHSSHTDGVEEGGDGGDDDHKEEDGENGKDQREEADGMDQHVDNP